MLKDGGGALIHWDWYHENNVLFEHVGMLMYPTQEIDHWPKHGVIASKGKCTRYIRITSLMFSFYKHKKTLEDGKPQTGSVQNWPSKSVRKSLPPCMDTFIQDLQERCDCFRRKHPHCASCYLISRGMALKHMVAYRGVHSS